MIKDLETENKIGIFSVGTAGHVMPSVRIINELRKKGFDLNNLLVVTGNRNEKKYYKELDVSVIEHDFVRTKKMTINSVSNSIHSLQIVLNAKKSSKLKKPIIMK